MEKIWDNIVIGSGMGGLSAASLLAKAGQTVLVLEKGTSPGGCCSSFMRGGYLFETGATTLIGWGKGMPLEKLEHELGIQFPKIELKLAMKIHMLDQLILRHTNKEEWIQECIESFGKPKRQKIFWKLTFSLSELVWDISERYHFFPIRSVSDIFRCLKVFRFSDIFSLFFSFVSTKCILFWLGLGGDRKFNSFLSEQLMITNQCSVDNAPFFSACAGLTYPNLKNYYVPGGMVELPNTLLEFITNRGGKFENKSEVISIEKITDTGGTHWNVKTKYLNYRAKNVISNLPIWNLAELYKGKNNSLKGIASNFEKDIWGAFTLGIALRVTLPIDECLHHQIHVKSKLPLGAGSSIFVSLSHIDDPMRTKNGIRILSISTHLESPEKWDKKAPDYHKKKQELTEAIVHVLETTFLWFKKDQIVALHAASPATWFKWTGRKFGRVGGIPSYYFKNPFRYVSPISQIPNLFLTGDTVYPGQGIPAVCLGGMNLANRMLLDKERLILP